jgi:hypothetical protein
MLTSRRKKPGQAMDLKAPSPRSGRCFVIGAWIGSPGIGASGHAGAIVAPGSRLGKGETRAAAEKAPTPRAGRDR